MTLIGAASSTTQLVQRVYVNQHLQKSTTRKLEPLSKVVVTCTHRRKECLTEPKSYSPCMLRLQMFLISYITYISYFYKLN